MAKKLYVGNLTYDTTEDNLVELFSEFGEVLSAQIIIDRDTNRSKGFGFVEMADGQAADEAANSLNGQDFRGRNLTVNEARPREDRGGGGGGGRGGYGGRGGGGGGYGGGGGGYGRRRWWRLRWGPGRLGRRLRRRRPGRLGRRLRRRRPLLSYLSIQTVCSGPIFRGRLVSFLGCRRSWSP